MGYTCSSAVFDFGKGREAPQHARRSLWRFIFRGFLTSNDCEECRAYTRRSLWSVIFREFLTSNGCESVERYISLEHLNACESEVPVCIEHSVCMESPDLFSDIADSNSVCMESPDPFSDIADSNSAIILTSLRPQSS